MTKYQYIGKTLLGEPCEGEIWAKNPDHLEKTLAQKGIILRSFIPHHGSLLAYIHSRLKKSEITRLSRQLAVLISSGIGISEAMESVIEQIEDKRLSRIFDETNTRIKDGNSISEAFRANPRYFDKLYTSLLESGELSGTLDISLERISSFREKTEEIQRKLKSAMAYPLLVLFVSAGVLIILLTYIIPIFSTMYANFGLELPVFTRHVICVSDWLKDSYAYIGFLTIVLGVIAVALIRLKKSRIFFHEFALRIPIFKQFIIKYTVANYCRTLGILTSSGVSLLTAVEIASNTIANEYIISKLAVIKPSLAEGLSLKDAIKLADVFPETVSRMVAAGESTGRLGEMLLKTADFYDNEVKTEISTIVSLIEPIVILILGIVVGFILVAMYLPLFELIGQMGY